MQGDSPQEISLALSRMRRKTHRRSDFRFCHGAHNSLVSVYARLTERVMDTDVSVRSMSVTSHEKTLRRQLSTLSKLLSAGSARRISRCLCRSRTLTEYELQVIQARPNDTQKTSELLLTVLRKGPRACQLFFKCLAVCSPLVFEKTTGCTVKATDIDHYHFEDDICSATTTETVEPYVINIHNSSLNNCIIGNNNGLCCLLSQPDDVSDKVEDVQRQGQQVAEQDSTDPPAIQVNSSHVEFVIIGDNNYMSVGSVPDSGEQEQRESGLEDSEGLN